MPLPRWQDLTTDEVQQLARRDPVVILPVGAIEQHGPHLPLSTDIDIAVGLIECASRHLSEDLPVAVLPPQVVGASHEHARFDGTLTLGPNELADVILALGASIVRSGIRRLVLSNTHGGNVPAIDTAGLALRDQFGQLVVKTSYFLSDPPEDIDLPSSEWRHGWHGGAVETAIMLHLHPERVRRQQIQDTRSLGQDLERLLRRVGPETGGAAFSWLAGDLSPVGVTGNATLATAELGGRLLDYYGRILADAVQDAKDFPLERLV